MTGIRRWCFLGTLPCALLAVNCDDKSTEDGDSSFHETTSYVRDYSYLEGKIFDLGFPNEFDAGDSIVSLFVYEQVDRAREPLAQPAILAVDVDPLSDTSLYTTEMIRLTGSDGVLQLDPGLYQFFSIPDSNRHYVVFSTRR